MTHSILLSGWGRYPVEMCHVTRPERYAHLVPAGGRCIARGLGRSYGDAAISTDATVILTERVNRLISFDDNSGVLCAEAGVTLKDILDVFVPRGWFPPVTPGTKFVSLGGCIAADVHGKNHHQAGSFSTCVLDIEVILADGSRRRCSPTQDADLYWATVGGMGLTGIISEVRLQMAPIHSAYILAEHRPARDLNHAMDLLDDPGLNSPYTVAWIDCLAGGRSLGRSIVMHGRHASRDELPGSVKDAYRPDTHKDRNLPVDFPSWVLNPSTVSVFNRIYYWMQGRKNRPFITDYNSFFYPLDNIGHWNRMYGKNGFVQYQCVIPTEHARIGLRALLREISSSRRTSFLAVLKRLGNEGPGLLSFPTAGYTLALDLPLHTDVLPLLRHLDDIVVSHGGRVYLAKDARLDADTFRKMYPRFPQWQRIKAACDPDNIFSSSLSRRLKMGGDA